MAKSAAMLGKIWFPLDRNRNWSNGAHNEIVPHSAFYRSLFCIVSRSIFYFVAQTPTVMAVVTTLVTGFGRGIVGCFCLIPRTVNCRNAVGRFQIIFCRRSICELVGRVCHAMSIVLIAFLVLVMNLGIRSGTRKYVQIIDLRDVHLDVF